MQERRGVTSGRDAPIGEKPGLKVLCIELKKKIRDATEQSKQRTSPFLQFNCNKEELNNLKQNCSDPTRDTPILHIFGLKRPTVPRIIFQ